jgi:hypothetical protein
VLIPGRARLFWCLLLLAPAGLVAQQPEPAIRVDSGTVVRLRLRSDSVVKGKLLSPYAGDSTRIRYCHFPAPPCRVGEQGYRERLKSDISSLEVHRGTGWLPGLVVGGAVGVGFGIFFIDLVESLGEVPLSTGEKITAMGGSVLVFGGLGTLIGSLFERWGTPEMTSP